MFISRCSPVAAAGTTHGAAVVLAPTLQISGVDALYRPRVINGACTPHATLPMQPLVPPQDPQAALAEMKEVAQVLVQVSNELGWAVAAVSSMAGTIHTRLLPPLGSALCWANSGACCAPPLAAGPRPSALCTSGESSTLGAAAGL